MAKKIENKKDLKKMISDINSERKKLLNFRFQKATGQLEKTSQIKKTRKNIAKLNTMIHQNKGINNA
tara:strand:- start:5333 stop:5533 length:201 start_codon:yes stop_codon:yes gene_type:complete